jgi:uncharacterized damage-inducible protein DinB
VKSLEKKRNVVDIQLSDEPAIGQWLWALQDTRKRTMEELDNVASAMIDWFPPGDESSIGTVLHHLALIEADWLYEEVLVQPIPPEVAALFPFGYRDAQGRLSQVQGLSLEQLLSRLDKVRGLLLDVYQGMDLLEFRRIRSLPDYDVTPEWVLHHLIQHEAEHRSQIGALRADAQRYLDAEIGRGS